MSSSFMKASLEHYCSPSPTIAGFAPLRLCLGASCSSSPWFVQLAWCRHCRLYLMDALPSSLSLVSPRADALLSRLCGPISRRMLGRRGRLVRWRMLCRLVRWRMLCRLVSLADALPLLSVDALPPWLDPQSAGDHCVDVIFFCRHSWVVCGGGGSPLPYHVFLLFVLCIGDFVGNLWITYESFVSGYRPFFRPFLLMKYG